MKKKVDNTLTNEQQMTIFHQLNKKISQERKEGARINRIVYYFSLTFAVLLLAVLVLPPSLEIFQQNTGGPNLGVTDIGTEEEQENTHEDSQELNEDTVEQDTEIPSFDPGHIRIDQIRTELQDYANTLEERGDYIGYTYSMDQLFKYFLAIHYGDAEFLDDSYDYSFSSFEQLLEEYQHVDFSSVDLVHMEHEGFYINVTLSYLSLHTGKQAFLQYLLDYSEHRLTDNSFLGELFSKTAFLTNVTVKEERVELTLTYAEKIVDEDAPNGFRIEETDVWPEILIIPSSVAVYMLEDPATLTKVEWDEVSHESVFIQVFEDEQGNVILITELYLP